MYETRLDQFFELHQRENQPYEERVSSSGGLQRSAGSTDPDEVTRFAESVEVSSTPRKGSKAAVDDTE